ncbi:MAG TPA: outer membrane lipoprotein carrier protein LolA [Candidatus Aminicenantes bacterium]|nr:outer membrane lipoprotein carrier protein LolA [Candidatus Aminicenantes bacterium]
MKCVVFYLILSLSGFSQNAADIASRTEQKLRSLISFQAEFKQVYYSSSVSTPLTEYGTVYYKRPGLMKWAYSEPEEKTVLLTENKIQYYFPEDNQLLIQDTTDEEQSNNIMSLLTGKTHILQDYDAETAEEDAAGSNYHIKLIPKYNDIENFILLDIDKKSLFIIKATFFDWAGNKQEFIFSRIQINRDMPDRTFDLIVPEDVEIIK